MNEYGGSMGNNCSVGIFPQYEQFGLGPASEAPPSLISPSPYSDYLGQPPISPRLFICLLTKQQHAAFSTAE
ncbi:hypothetical protein RvY_12636 [Ramazzottius varieornatus]|uniref:Uncharacterized protein n=1 Tax=Ramazzottius varieornatus TaxID=947166 RepID=A0A1D1VK65_RAMVA|nr:hypothetical protein RvY_12636 [Ramazzottius varieornatus]